MSKMAIVYWSGTGNTESIATLIAEGAKSNGAEVSIFSPLAFSESSIEDFDKLAFGCPSTGAEQLEPSEFEPMFEAIASSLSGKSIALFGSYGWGNGQWMQDWQERCKAAGADVYTGEGLIVNQAPTGETRDLCVEFGSGFAQA